MAAQKHTIVTVSYKGRVVIKGGGAGAVRDGGRLGKLLWWRKREGGARRRSLALGTGPSPWSGGGEGEGGGSGGGEGFVSLYLCARSRARVLSQIPGE